MALSIRRIFSVLAVMAVVAAMVAAMAVPAFAAQPAPPQGCHFEQGKTFCRELVQTDSYTERTVRTYEITCPGQESPGLITETTDTEYADYRVTETTYAGLSDKVLDQITYELNRMFRGSHTFSSGGC
jgi:hypothetical protein